MSDTSKYNIKTESNIIVENNDGTITGIDKKVQTTEVSLDSLLKNFYDFITEVQKKHTQLTNETEIIEAIEVEAQSVKTQNYQRWQNFLSLKRLIKGSQTAAIKFSEYYVESTSWGKAAVGFIEGVMEDPK